MVLIITLPLWQSQPVPVLLSEKDVRAVLTMDDLIAAMEAALIAFSAGRVAQPLRTVLDADGRGFFGVMPAYMPQPGSLGAKLVTVFHGNAAADLPTHLATIVLLDPCTGELVAIVDGRYITEARTAAVSAVSVELLAREDAATLAIIGSGVQARSHLEAITRVRNVREVRVWSPRESSRDAFIREMRPKTTAAVFSTPSPREAVENADLVVLATAARAPVVQSNWIADGAHICAVGACRPDQREMDSGLVARGRVFVDSRTGATSEAGDIMIPIAEGTYEATRIAAELGEVAAHTKPGRTSPGEVTIFKSLGMAVEDVAAAHLAFVKASERGLGRGFVL
jgi:alanine dehydrogenase